MAKYSAIIFIKKMVSIANRKRRHKISRCHEILRIVLALEYKQGQCLSLHDATYGCYCDQMLSYLASSGFIFSNVRGVQVNYVGYHGTHGWVMHGRSIKRNRQ